MRSRGIQQALEDFCCTRCGNQQSRDQVVWIDLVDGGATSGRKNDDKRNKFGVGKVWLSLVWTSNAE